MRLYRLPENREAAAGTPIPDDTLKRMSGDRDHGIFESLGQDTRHIYAFKQLRLRNNSTPYSYMSVGIPKERVVHQANVEMLRNLSILGVAALVSVCLAWILGNLAFIRPIKHLVAAAQRFGMGEMESAHPTASHT